MNPSPQPQVVAVVLAGILDDWLESLGLTLDDFCDVMVGSWVFNYVSALRAVGVQLIVIAIARVKQPLNRLHLPTGARICLLPSSSACAPLLALLDPLLLPKAIKRRLRRSVIDLFSTPKGAIRVVLRREQVSAVLVQDYETTRFDVVVSVARSMSLPVFGTFTGNSPQSRLYRLRRLRSMRRATGFVICAQSEVERLRTAYRVPEGKVRKIYYPIDRSVWFPEDRELSRRALGLDRNATIAVYHGLIHMHVKGLDVLLEAWDELFGAGSRRDRRLLILGDGIDAGALAERIRARGGEDIAFMNGWHHDRSVLRRYLSAADVYVFPSRVDAFGIAVTEAMACGLPVVAAAGRGMADILPDGERSGGIVVPSGDARAFAEALGRMMDDPALRERVGANAMRRISDPVFGSAVGDALKDFLFA